MTPKPIDTKSGFLSDYSTLEASKKDDQIAVYKADGYDIKNYKNIIFDPVEVNLSPELQKDSTLGPVQQKQIADFVARELNKRLSKGFTGKGDGTLKIRSSVSGMSSASENLSFYQILPITFAVTAALEVSGQRDKDLVLFLELEGVDQASGEVVASQVMASDFGLADTGELKDNPVKAIEQILQEWIDKTIDDFGKSIQ